MKKINYLFIFIFLSSLLNFNYSQPSGEKIFSEKCLSCHTIGEGKRIGPDLANIHTRREENWLLKFISSSQSLITQGDSTAVSLFKENNNAVMPDKQLSNIEIKAVINYITLNSPDPNNPDVRTPKQIFDATSVTDLFIQRGKALFEGTKKFTNGAAPCISCHNVQLPGVFTGGNIAVDLSAAFTRLSAAGVDGIIRNPPFPAMINNFAESPLTDEEIKYLMAYLYYSDNWNLTQNHTGSSDANFVLFTVLMLDIILLAMLLYWQRVKKLSVNALHQ